VPSAQKSAPCLAGVNWSPTKDSVFRIDPAASSVFVLESWINSKQKTTRSIATPLQCSKSTRTRTRLRARRGWYNSSLQPLNYSTSSFFHTHMAIIGEREAETWHGECFKGLIQGPFSALLLKIHDEDLEIFPLCQFDDVRDSILDTA